jgi:hypothetical protein
MPDGIFSLATRAFYGGLAGEQSVAMAHGQLISSSTITHCTQPALISCSSRSGFVAVCGAVSGSTWSLFVSCLSTPAYQVALQLPSAASEDERPVCLQWSHATVEEMLLLGMHGGSVHVFSMSSAARCAACPLTRNSMLRACLGSRKKCKDDCDCHDLGIKVWRCVWRVNMDKDRLRCI